MTKRKIMLLAMALCMVAILAVGGTLAYFTAEDSADNVFTMGYVDIELEETFEQKSDLVPGLDINKDVYVKNTGSNPAYVRVHIAIPADMDDGNPDFNATNNFLHFNFTNESVADGQWSWLPEYSTGVGYKGNGAGNFNYYDEVSANGTTVPMVIDGEEYAVYVVTYRSKLEKGTQTATQALDKVYLDKTVNAVKNDDGSITYTDTKGNSVPMTPDENGKCTLEIKVWAEATQVETFENAYDALNTAFGVPGTYNPWDN